MIKKTAIFLIAGILVGVSAFVLSGRPDALVSVSAQQSVSTAASDDKIFRHLFRRIAALKARADEIERRGGDAGSVRGLFQRKANLDDRQARILEQIAWQCAIEMSVVDERASQIARAFRAQYPNGEVPRGQIPAPPPAELRQLSETRRAIVLRRRDELRAAFGESEFNRFQEFVKNKIRPNVNPPSAGQ